ncbi:uncharacterized protein LOC105695411, partial [Orussus abietinus]|uniref:uncharacterized protein LOC105695411 n=1 Tax=Orussus abietinus TaxID=222816 RepID=UPI00062585EA
MRKKKTTRSSDTPNTSIDGNKDNEDNPIIEGDEEDIQQEAQARFQNKEKMPETPSTLKLKLPPFWKESPKLWFVQIEAAFDIYAVTADDVKFRYAILHLDTSILPLVSDIIEFPPEKNKYEALKERIIQSLDETSETKLRKLLRGQSIGNEKPSVYLQKLKNLSGGQCGDSVLKTLFLEQLPEHSRSILAISEVTDLNKLANLADKMDEMIKPVINETASTSQTTEPHVSEIDFKIIELTKAVESLTQQFQRSRSRSRSDRQGKWHNPQQNNNHRTNTSQNGLCYYHYKFGDKFYKCNKPCSWGQAVNTKEPTIFTLDVKSKSYKILREFVDVTKPTPKKEGIHQVQHHITVKGAPIAEKTRRLPPFKYKAAKQAIEEMMKEGIYQPSSSNWASPIHLVPKQEGGWRLC